MTSVMRVTAVSVLSAAVAGCISYAAVSWLLGFGLFGSGPYPFEDVRASRVEIREVLVFERGGHLDSAAIDDFAAALGVAASTLISRDRSHPDYVPLETVVRLNPYPQPLRTEHYPYWLSAGFRSHDTAITRSRGMEVNRTRLPLC